MFNLFNLDDRVTAAAVAATGTIIGALIQLRMAWRKEVADRSRGAPVTKKSRRGPVAAVLLLLVAAGVGGFAFSQSLVQQSARETAELRGELRTQLEQINATAARLELAAMSDRGQAPVDDVRRAPQEVTITTTVGPCHARVATSNNAAAPCSEQDAQAVTLCASVPSSAAVGDTALYARAENSPQPWANSQVVAGQDIGRARFADKPVERPESDQTKQVCAGFSSWDADHAYSARLVVRYGAAPAAPAVNNAQAARPSEAPNATAARSSEVAGAPAPRPSEVTNPVAAPITAAVH